MLRAFFLSSLMAVCLLSASSTTVTKKSALDKPTMEAYVRHLFVWGPQIHIEVGDPQPSSIPGFYQVVIHASAGTITKDVPFFVSKDGRKILQGVVYDVSQNPFKSELDKLTTQLQPSYGTPGAPVVLVEFSDFECGFCKQEATVLRSNILSAYPKQVRVYYKDFPLVQIHPWAMTAALAGRCIFRQNAGAFWDYHDWMFAHQDEITKDNVESKILEYAKGKNLDVLQLSRCLKNRETQAEVDRSIAEGKALNINSTPTLFINGRPLVGRQDWPTLRAIIDYEIQYQKTAKNAGEDCGCEVKLPSPVGN